MEKTHDISFSINKKGEMHAGRHYNSSKIKITMAKKKAAKKTAKKTAKKRL